MPNSRIKQVPEFTDAMLAKARKRIQSKSTVTPSGCWEWPSPDPERYGRLCVDYFQDYTHRWAHRAFIGPLGDLHVLHHCDNIQCCNPEHLFLGDHDENMQDMVNKARSPREMDRFGCKLTDEQVRDIRAKSDKGFPLSWIAAEYPDVHREHVRQIMNRRVKSPGKYVRQYADT